MGLRCRVPKRVGLIIGDEPLVERALTERLERAPAIVVERVVIGGTPERLIGPHDAIFDRMSRFLPHYRSYLRAASLNGARVMNDPLSEQNDRFYALALAARRGLPVPRAMLLPQKSYGPGFDPSRSLGNLEFPLKWRELAHYVGYPAVLVPTRVGHGDGEAVNDDGALLAAYDRTGASPTMLRRAPAVTQRASVFCVGTSVVVASEAIDAARRDDAARLAQDVTSALGLAFNRVEIAWEGDRAWLLEALDPAPRLSPHVVGAEFFDKLMDALAEHLVVLAHGRPAPVPGGQ